MGEMSIDQNQQGGTTRQLAGRAYGWLGKPVSRGWLVLAVCVFTVACLGWWTRLRPAAPVWGPVSEWVGGLGQFIAVVFLAWQIALLRSDQAARVRGDEEAVRTRAKAVVVTAEEVAGGRIACRASNTGLFPVYSATLQCGTISTGHTFTASGEKKPVPSGGVLLPATEPAHIEFYASPEAPGELRGVAMDFADALGNHWRRIVSLDGSINATFRVKLDSGLTTVYDATP